MNIPPSFDALRKFAALTRADRHLLVTAIGWHALIVVFVRTLPLGRSERILTALAGRRRRLADPHATGRIAWAASTAAHRSPLGATCLTEAMTARLLLARRGAASMLRFGVARAPTGAPNFHAWLERDGIVVLGAPALTYARFPTDRFDE